MNFDDRAARAQAWNELLKALEKPTLEEQVDTIVGAWARGAWIKKYKTEPPESAIPTAEQIIRWYNKCLIEAVNRSPKDSLIFLQRYKLCGGVAGILANQKGWLRARTKGSKQRHPLEEIIQAWQSPRRTIETASTAAVSGTVRIPYKTSEVMRRQWRPIDGDVNAVMVDGEPLATRLTDVALPGKKARIYASNAQGPMTVAISTQREPNKSPCR